MTRSFIVVLSAASLAVSGCASIVAGSTDPVKVITTPPSSAECSLTNQRGSWTGTTSSEVIIKRSRTDLNVNCADAATGMQGKQTLVSGVEPWVFGNILIGGLIGLGIDWGTGATYDYPDSVMVEMKSALTEHNTPPASFVDPQPQIQQAPATGFVAPAVEQTPGIIAAPPIFIPASK